MRVTGNIMYVLTYVTLTFTLLEFNGNGRCRILGNTHGHLKVKLGVTYEWQKEENLRVTFWTLIW